jgi:hypothetical protein
MRLAKLSDFTGGWIIGDFTPSMMLTSDFEICIKHFKSGEYETAHYQQIATEFTIVVSGSCRMGTHALVPGDILMLDPGEISDFEAIEDVVVVGIKTPSVSTDKVTVIE